MPTLNVSRVVNNPKFAQTFTIQRSSGGAFNTSGVWTDSSFTVNMYGIIKPATPKELDQLPDGDRVKEVRSFHSAQPMYVTHNDATPGLSDIATWNGQHYRLSKLYEWEDFGYYKALGVRIEGE